jgi:hypothetical protein
MTDPEDVCARLEDGYDLLREDAPPQPRRIEDRRPDLIGNSSAPPPSGYPAADTARTTITRDHP